MRSNRAEVILTTKDCSAEKGWTLLRLSVRSVFDPTILLDVVGEIARYTGWTAAILTLPWAVKYPLRYILSWSEPVDVVEDGLRILIVIELLKSEYIFDTSKLLLLRIAS